MGDTGLKEFAGSLAQFSDSKSVEKLIKSAGKAQVAALAERLDIVSKVDGYDLRGEFLANIDVDDNGAAYLDQSPEITFVGRSVLNAKYISDERDAPIHTPVSFDVSGFQITEYTVDADSKTFIAPVRASELIKLDGISNQALFVHNVRGPLGNTNVNKAIAASVQNASLHKSSPSSIMASL